jgi:Winged helix DNA-binding domain
MHAHAVSDVLSDRELNRATLARQLLLERAEMRPLDTIEHLVGMQAQVPLNPYTGLWSRLRRFRPEMLAQLLEERQVVRIPAMRATIHLLTADDCLVLRPLMQPVLDAELARHPEYAPALDGVDVGPVLEFARPLLAERPRTGAELRKLMEERFPKENGAALAYACRCLLALVQVPPRGVWGRSAQVASTTAESWLGRPLARRPSIDDVVLRYLAAYGPAAVADVATWSRLTGLREVVERLRPRLRAFRDERGRELFDLPDAPRPDPDTPAPVRFLPEYDNALLSHADRSRFLPDGRSSFVHVSTPIHGTVLHDGFLCGTWRLERLERRDTAMLAVDHVVRLPKRAALSVAAEGRRLLRFLTPDATTRDVRFVPVE